MLAYAATRPTPVERRPYPNAMLVIIAVHGAVIAAVMSAKMDLPRVIRNVPIDVFTVKPPKSDPPPPATPTTNRPQPTNTITYTRPDPFVPVPLPPEPGVPTAGPANPGPIGPVAVNLPVIRPAVHNPIKLGPTLLTAGDDLKPPYPSSKLLTEEEAVLTLRLTIDERGRVVAVEPVGKTDPVFLAAARRHLLAHWRYKPASEDGQAIGSSAVITLRFQLDG
ncbi:MAG TPA: energy transducer TonB [Sphingomicrobium sp.]